MEPICKKVVASRDAMTSASNNTFNVVPPAAPVTGDPAELARYQKELKEHQKKLKEYYSNTSQKHSTMMSAQKNLRTEMIRLQGYQTEFNLIKSTFIQKQGPAAYNEFIESKGLTWGLGVCWWTKIRPKEFIICQTKK